MAKELKSAEEILSYYRDFIYPIVLRYLKTPIFPLSFKIPSKYISEEKFFQEIISEYPKRKGKYLRPTLLSLTAQAMGAKVEDTICVASAMQISEEWLLIHDDLEDDSPKRRGLPSLHKIYNIPLAVNAGDALHVAMWRALFDSRRFLDKEKVFRILDEFYTQLMRTTLGQMTEIKWSKDKRMDFDDNDWYFVADGKTSYYTIACPMRLGAIIADGSRQQLDKLAKFGIYLGRAFQLTDDILDVTSDFGGRKEFAGDVYEGKVTVILGYLLKKASLSDKKKLISILKKSREEKTEREVLWVVKMMKEYGAIDYAKDLALKWKQKARDYFDQHLDFIRLEPYRSYILTLVDFITNRSY